MADKIQENDVVALLIDIHERQLHRGEIGKVVEIVAPSRADPGYVLVEFENGTQADIDDTGDILKLSFLHKPSAAAAEPTLAELAGKSEMVALVFTDIVDSTKIANELGDERWIELLKIHFEKARRLMANSDHKEIKIIGDSFMVAFRSASDALDFALGLSADTGSERITIRAGIHVGSAAIVDDDMFGLMVNYTKRVESAGNGIQVSNFAKTEIDNKGRHRGLDFAPKEADFHGFLEPQKIWVVSDPMSVFRPPKGWKFTSQS